MKALRMGVFIAVALAIIMVGPALAGEIKVEVPCWPVAVSTEAQGYAAFAGKNLKYLGKTGEPALPSHLVKVLLPPDADLGRVSVFLEKEVMEEVPGTWEVRPVPPAATREGTVIWPEGHTFDDQGRDLGIYGVNVLFPARLLGQVATGQMRTWRLADVPLTLYQYNPVTKRLYCLAEATLVVTYEAMSEGLKSFSMTGGPSAPADDIGKETVKRITVNFREMAPMYERQEKSILEREAPAPVSIPEESRYIIITTKAIVSKSKELSRFVESKGRRGFTVRVVTEEEWGGGTGDGAAEKIRGWLKANYLSLKIEYVLLIGNPHPDWGDLPMKRLWPRSPAQDRDSPSDYYYADLTGNWDLDGDGYYGEAPVEVSPGVMNPNDFGLGGVDVNWDVLVGRIPYYGNIADLDHILAKIMVYENTSQSRAAWRKKVLLPMNPSDQYTPGYQLGEEIKQDVIMPKGWGYHRVYEEPYGLTPPPETTPCTVDNVTSAWKGDKFGAIFWWTHGSNWSAVDVMDLYHTPDLNDQYPGFTFQASCDNAFPEFQDNLAYGLLKNGAIATVAATRWSWYWVGQGTPFFPLPFAGSPSNSGLTYEYARRLITDELDSGHALYEMKQELGPGIWMNFTVFNLYGDPTTGLFSFSPQDLYYLTVNIIGGGQVVLDPPGGVYPPGTTVKLTAVPDKGCAFDGWSGDVSSFDNPETVVMNSDMNVTAEFWCPQVGKTFNLCPTGDAWVRRGESGNDGAGNHLKIQKDRKEGYLKFDLRGLCGAVTSVILTCTTSMEDKRGTVHVHGVYNNGWAEETLEGKNAPAIGPRLDSATASGMAGEKIHWDVTQFVAEAIAKGAEFVSFALAMTEDYQVYFSSKENRGGIEAPVLKVTVSPCKEMLPSDDAWVSRGEPGNDGTGNHLKVQSNRKDGYLKFDVREVGGGVSSATLTATTSLDHKKGTVHVHGVKNNSWKEETIDGENAPAIGSRLDSAKASGAAGEKISWDVTQFVRDAVCRGAQSVSFALVMTDGYQVYFSSKENKGGREAPVLKIE